MPAGGAARVAAVVAARNKEHARRHQMEKATTSNDLTALRAEASDNLGAHRQGSKMLNAEKSVQIVETPLIQDGTAQPKSKKGMKPAGSLRRGVSVATVAHITQDDVDCHLKNLRCPWFWRYQLHARAFYKNIRVQITVAALIAGNFSVNIIEKQIDPRGTKYTDTFYVFELFFNIAFTIELLVNMYAFWFKRFWKSGWNVFDVIVVSIGILTTSQVPLPGPFSLLRIMRAFRVFRLFKRVESLNSILVSLAKAMPGVVNAFVLLFIVMSIYAMLAVEFFKDFADERFFINESGEEVPLETPRGQKFGNEYYGNFMKSFYTLFQVLMGDSWSEASVRVLVHRQEKWPVQVATGIFFTSFVIVNGVVLVNVVVAVLLEKMMGGKDMEEEAKPMDADEEPESPCSSPSGALPPEVVMDKDVETMKADLLDVREQLERVLLAIGGLRNAGAPEDSGKSRGGALQGQLPGQVADSTEMDLLGKWTGQLEPQRTRGDTEIYPEDASGTCAGSECMKTRHAEQTGRS
mmetsp:Transcript_36500/g.83888  ORF Transcript_36500/g.83888 Transcript_36500/m.83888 type:complete len:521 (-) Transcript_36500:101-1663(-)